MKYPRTWHVRLDNPKIVNIYSKKNRFIPNALYHKLKEKNKCRLCGISKVKAKKLYIHHKIPVIEGGKNVEENLIVVCKECHDKLHKERDEKNDKVSSKSRV
jgi:5-methylcytosine-specific restriction endonuclease McrA